MKTIIAAYIYPGWHSCPERDRNFPSGFSEWELVFGATPRFDGHYQPRIPVDGRYDDSCPDTASKQISLAQRFGVNLFIYGFFWSRGKRVLYRALDNGFLNNNNNNDFPFAVMWANRMPRGVLPVKLKPCPEIDPNRLVYTDPEDFFELIKFLETNYFQRSNYFRINKAPLLSIFDSTFFIRQLGIEQAKEAIDSAKMFLIEKGYEGLHLMAINPAPKYIKSYKDVGFDSISHYVWLPDWKGNSIQQYNKLVKKRPTEWLKFQQDSGMLYFPSVSPGWDATPRGQIYKSNQPKKYPWAPVVIDGDPDEFYKFIRKATRYSKEQNEPAIVFIASWNEWSEGHYLEPDKKYGTAWLEAVLKAKNDE